MKKALIEKATNRLCQVEPINPDPASGGTPFPVSDALAWVDCADNVTAEAYNFDGASFVPKPSMPIGPNVSGFVSDLKTAMGGIVASNALARAYPLFYPALEAGAFDDVQNLIADAHKTAVLSDAQYAAFKQLAAQRNLPIVLP